MFYTLLLENETLPRYLGLMNLGAKQKEKNSLVSLRSRRMPLRDRSGEEKASTKSIVGYIIQIFFNPENSTLILENLIWSKLLILVSQFHYYKK